MSDALAVLRAQIDKKRKLIESTSSGPKKWVKKSDLVAKEIKEKQEHYKAKVAKEAEKIAEEGYSSSDGGGHSANGSPVPRSVIPKAATKEAPKVETEDPEVLARRREGVIRRLRARGQPVTLFGETDSQREERLRLLQVSEPDNMEGEKNDFQEALQSRGRPEGKESDSDDDADAAVAKGKASRSRRVTKGSGVASDSGTTGGAASGSGTGRGEAAGVMSTSDSEHSATEVEAAPAGQTPQPEKRIPEEYIRSFLKKLLNEWEIDLDKRPEHVKKTAQGKVDAAIMKQAAKYIKPFFKQLRSRTCPPEIVEHCEVIVEYMEKLEYVPAHEEYMRMAIGNAPWPMGVTMVGIHERSAREKIFTNQVAHVLNDETQRKYISSLKRLMTFCQRRYPAAPSKCVLNAPISAPL